MAKIKYNGWRRDLPDYRDHAYAAPAPVLRTLPDSIDLTPVCPEVYSQLTLGSCTANAIVAVHQFLQRKEQAVMVFRPSRLFTYFNERDIEGTIDEDSGAMIRTGMQSVAQQGVCPETMWPYDIEKFRVRPPDSCYVCALDHQVVLYQRIPRVLNQLKGCLADGYPFVFGITVYESYESSVVTATGQIPVPQSGEGCIGGHCLYAAGYDDNKQRFVIRNSYSESWGQHGNGTLPYAYLMDPGLSADFWTMRLVEI